MSATPVELRFTAPRRAKPPRHLADLSPEERRAAVAELGEKPFRGRQLSVHYFERLVDDPERMTDLPAASRAALAQALLPTLVTPVVQRECDGGDTVKTLWKLFDGARVESVLMRYPDRVTVCISSQAGCGMACPFCATGQAGLTRNLSTAEIVEQVMAAARSLGGAARVSNVVFMGMGEPLANYGALLRALRRLTDPAPDGLGLSARGITVSTVGLVPAIDRLAGEGLPVTLALSLHAPDDALRRELIPWGKGVPIAELIGACEYYFERTGREITLEYVLLDGVNMAREHARGLARIARRLRANVNLLRYNPVAGAPYERPTAEAAFAFQAELRAVGVNAHVRTSRGKDAAAACGQLRRANATRGEHGPPAGAI